MSMKEYDYCQGTLKADTNVTELKAFTFTQSKVKYSV